ncbi:hypothetical protein K502DRAFT_367553 [Neoconidiobolus thromboides FSU 785]|nr:hypothetical protein K502DRAFT_367553 [Neoconidiobolus thromboides FSU 785]
MRFDLFLLIIVPGIAYALPHCTEVKEAVTKSGCNITYPKTLLPNQKLLKSKCFIATDSGSCRASIPSYHYDPISNSCTEGLYGGCPDGCQVFKTKDECESECKVEPENKEIDPLSSFQQSECNVEKTIDNKNVNHELPIGCFIKTQTGMCRMSVPSFHFDMAAGKCIKSVFGGCKDGCLAFTSLEECEGTCLKASS